MKDEGRARLKDAIVQVLNEARQDTSLTDLLTRLHERGETDDTSTKAAIWHLIAAGDVELTSRRTLRIPEKYRGDFVLAR
jgi:hypothetical protein